MGKTYYYVYIATKDPYLITYMSEGLYSEEVDWLTFVENLLGTEVETLCRGEDGLITIKVAKQIPRIVKEAMHKVPYEIGKVLEIDVNGIKTYVFIPK